MPKSFIGEPFCAVFQKVSGDEKIFGNEGGGGVKIFCRKFFCLTMPKCFIEEPFCAVFQKVSGDEKVLDKRGGEYQDIPSKIFLSQIAEKFHRQTFLCSVPEKFR